MKYRLVAVLLALIAAVAGAQSDQWEFRFGPRFWGATVAGRYMLEPPAEGAVETSVTGLLSSAYESKGYYRTPDGSLYSGDDSLVSYNRFDLLWQLGLQQGILSRADSSDDAAVAFVFYRGRYALPFEQTGQLFFQSGLPATDDSLTGAVVGGLAYRIVETHETTRVSRGVQAELAIEWGPAFLHNQLLSDADYSRTTLSARGYLPLYELEPEEGMNRFSAYLAGFGVLDWSTGPVIPLSVRSTTGGRSLRSAPGGSVRGYASGRFDATFKAVANAEVRANLPSIAIPEIVPGLVVYTDGGYYLDEDSLSPQPTENQGFLLSSGAGFYLDLFRFAELVFYTNYVWIGTDVAGASWVPFSLGFGFHY